MTQFSQPLRLHLDGDALVANWRTLASLSGNAATGAAVKANGYGLGARQVVTRLRDAGCKDFFVAHWGEAEAIADLVPPGWISVLNGIAQGDVCAAITLGAVPVLNTPQQVVIWKSANGGRCHVMIDSGINRLGIGPEQLCSDLLDRLEIDILMSHLASADEDVEQNANQLSRFTELSETIEPMRRSLANSAGIMLGPKYHFDLTRPGLSLYGGIARPEMADHINPVVRIASRILQVRQLQSGDPVGYNATHICSKTTKVATLSIGYADGYLRSFSNIGKVVIRGIEAPVIGRVSMDLVTVDISAVPDLKEGDWVDINYDLIGVSRLTGLSQYELLTGLGSRSQRIWA
jgi:alanine racemase